MKLSTLFLLWLALAAAVNAQATLTIPAATTESVSLVWTDPTACTTTAPCTFNIYRIGGSCPATIVGSSGWTLLPVTGSDAASASDTTITPGSTYSYVVETLQAGANSGPSNCATTTVPLVPAAPTGLTVTG